MRGGIIVAFVVAGCTASGPLLAQAIDEDPESAELAPRNAFEIGVHGGYTQPAGDIAANRRLGDLVEAGGAVALELAYRLSPHWAIGLYGHFHESRVDTSFVDELDVRGVSSGTQVTYHALPFEDADPYVAFGGGYRFLWLVPSGPPAELIHGLQVAKLLLGIDLRLNENVALGPTIGADLDLFLWDRTNESIDDPRPSAFFSAGLTGRFDVFGTREDRHGTIIGERGLPIDVSQRATGAKP